MAGATCAVVLRGLCFGIVEFRIQHNADPARFSPAIRTLQFSQLRFQHRGQDVGVIVAICCFSLLCGGPRSPRANTELLVLLAMLSLLLAMDYFFLLHERYVYQKGIFLFYAICALSLLVRHYRWIIKNDGFAFLLAGMLLAFLVLN
jgi:hypothetical protein